MNIENFNTADESQVKKADKREKVGRDKELDDLKYLLGLPQFRRFSWRLLAHCGFLQVPFNTNNSQQSFLIGRMDIAHFLFSEMNNADEELVFKMMKEGKSNVK